MRLVRSFIVCVDIDEIASIVFACIFNDIVRFQLHLMSPFTSKAALGNLVFIPTQPKPGDLSTDEYGAFIKKEYGLPEVNVHVLLFRTNVFVCTT